MMVVSDTDEFIYSDSFDYVLQFDTGFMYLVEFINFEFIFLVFMTVFNTVNLKEHSSDAHEVEAVQAY